MGAKIKPWIALKKKRGGQPGNQNRRTHGFYGAESRIRAGVIAALVRECDAVIAWVDAHVALKKKAARAAERRKRCVCRAARLLSHVHRTCSRAARAAGSHSAASRLARFCAYIAWSARLIAVSGLSLAVSSNAP